MIMRDLSQFADELKRCAYCHDQCMSSAPEVVASSDQAKLRSRLAILLRLLASGQWEWSQEVADSFFYALNDGIQVHYCIFAKKEGQRTEPYLRAARAEAISRGFIPAFLEEPISQFEMTGSLHDHAGISPEVIQPTGDAPVLIYDAAVCALAPDSISAARRLMLACCPDAGECMIKSVGFVEHDLGLESLAERASHEAARVLAGISGNGPVVAISPLIAYALTVILPRWGIDLGRPVMSLSQYLASQRDRLVFSPFPGAITLHDDWAMARGLGDTASVRELLGAIPQLKLIEPINSGVRASSDGPLGFYPDEDLAKNIAAIRYNELKGTSADVIITCSPYGLNNLLRAVSEVPVIDLFQFLAERVK